MKFPFTNYQEINLDWILEIVKKFQLLIPSMQEAESNVQAAIDAATEATGKAETAITTATGAVTTSEEAKNTAELANRTAQAAGNTALAAEATARAANATAEEAKTIAGEAMEIAQTAYDKAPIIINSASGNPASFPDGADSMPVKRLVANIEPVQDLHGYDHPWPGGGSKNKLPNNAVTSTIQGVTFTVNSDKSITVNGTSTGWTGLNLGSFTLPAGNYKLVSLVPSSNTYNCYLILQAAGTTIANTSSSSTGAEFTLEEATEINCKLFARPNIALSNVVCYPMIILSTETDISYLPYSNICPISGWTGMNLYHAPEYDAEAEPTLSVTWSDEAGTVYGGTLDVINGKLIANRKTLIFDGTETYWKIISGAGQRYYLQWASIGDSVVVGGVLCSHLIYLSGNYGIFGTYNFTTNLFAVKDMEQHFSGLDEFKQWLADQYASGTPLMLSYRLATPIEYQLTPQQIYTLLGSNNIWADTGAIEECEYPADTKLYIDNKIASTRNEG